MRHNTERSGPSNGVSGSERFPLATDCRACRLWRVVGTSEWIKGRETCERPRLLPDRCCGPRVLASGGPAAWGAAALPAASPQLLRGKVTGGVPPTRTAPGLAALTLCWSSGVSTGCPRWKPFRTCAAEILRDGIATQASRGKEDQRREPTGCGKPEWMCCPPSSSPSQRTLLSRCPFLAPLPLPWEVRFPRQFIMTRSQNLQVENWYLFRQLYVQELCYLGPKTWIPVLKVVLYLHPNLCFLPLSRSCRPLCHSLSVSLCLWDGRSDLAI